jgi:hypothetical protein
VIPFLWRVTRGYRLCPWRSPYLRWRIETYSGLHAEKITARDFFGFCWRERRELWRYLQWVSKSRRFTPMHADKFESA